MAKSVSAAKKPTGSQDSVAASLLLFNRVRLRYDPALLAAQQAVVAERLASEFAVCLAEQMDEINSFDQGVKMALARAFSKCLRTAAKADQRALFFHDTIPGFSLVMFKRELEAGGVSWMDKSESSKPSEMSSDQWAESSVEARAASALISSFFERTGNSVIVIDYADLTMVFFPASDFKKNVRELGYLDLADPD